jgi:hypothetical protein
MTFGRSGAAHAVVLLMSLLFASCQRDIQQPPASRRDVNGELAALQLSTACSTAAEAFWRRGGYDRPGPPAKGTSERSNYQSHYNSEQKRCFVLTELLTELPSGASVQHLEVFDAVEGGYPFAILHRRIGTPSDPTPTTVSLLKANQTIPATRENLDWFAGLMLK